MKKALVIFAVVALTLSVAYGLPAAQMMGGPGMMGGGQGSEEGRQATAPEGGYGYGYGCPGSYGWGGYGMGPGMMHGYGMGPGMMHGYGMGPGMMGGYGMGPGMMGGYGMGPGMMGGYGYGYGPESQKFLDETRDLRKQLHTKMFDYMEALRDPNTKREQIDNMREEIWNLQKQLYEKYGR